MLTGIISLTSCSAFYIYTQVPTGRNIHQKFIGSDKNTIVKNYGIPDKRMSDEQGGEIFAYEKVYINTNTTSSSFQSINLYSNNIYNNGFGGSNSTTTTDKTFVNFFFNKNGKVYDYRSNYGAITRTKKELNKKKLWWLIGVEVGVATIMAVTLPLVLL